MQREPTSSGNTQAADSQRFSPAHNVVANPRNEKPKAISPTSMIGFRPKWSLRLPQKAEENIQIVAEAAKMEVTRSGPIPNWRPAGERTV